MNIVVTVLHMTLLAFTAHGIKLDGGIWRDIRKERWNPRESIILVGEMLSQIRTMNMESYRENTKKNIPKVILVITGLEMPKNVIDEYVDETINFIYDFLRPLNISLEEDTKGEELAKLYEKILGKRLERFIKRYERATIDLLKSSLLSALPIEEVDYGISALELTIKEIVNNVIDNNIVPLLNSEESNIDNVVLGKTISMFKSMVDSTKHAGDEGYFISLMAANIVYQACYKGKIDLAIGLVEFGKYVIRNPDIVGGYSSTA